MTKAWRIKKEYLSDDGCFSRGGGNLQGSEFDPANDPDYTPPDEGIAEPPAPGNDPMSATSGQVSPTIAPQQPVAPPISMGNVVQETAQQAPQSMSGQDQFMSGVRNEANAQGTAANAQAAAYSDGQAKMDDLANTYQQNLVKHESEVNQITADMQSSKIDPEHYMNSRSTGNKVGLAIGLLLGGLGSGLTGGENPVLKTLQQNIKDDIDAQVENRRGKENLLSALEKQYGNRQDAMRMLGAVYNNQMAARVQEAALRSGSPMAQARADQIIGQLKSQSQAATAQVAQAATIKQMAAKGQVKTAEAVPYLVPKEHQKAAFEEIKKSEGIDRATQEIQNVRNLMVKQNSLGQRVFHPVDSSQLRGMAGTVISGLGKDIYGRLNESELKLLKNFETNSFTSQKVAYEGTELLKNLVEKHRSTPVLDAFGLSKQSTPQQSAGSPSSFGFKPKK